MNWPRKFWKVPAVAVGLARSKESAEKLQAQGITAVMGDITDLEMLAKQASKGIYTCFFPRKYCQGKGTQLMHLLLQAVGGCPELKTAELRK